MLMLMPDARFDGAAEYEQAVVGDRAEVRVYQANTLNDIPNDVWEATDGLMVWGRTPCNKDMLDRAENARIVISYGRWLRRYRYRGSGQARHRCLQRAGLRHDGRCRSCDWFDVVADMRGIVRHHTALVDEPVAKWRAIDTPIVRRARGATFGIVGRGRIGTAAGLRAKALGMNVMFYDPFIPDGGEQSVGSRKARDPGRAVAPGNLISSRSTRH